MVFDSCVPSSVETHGGRVGAGAVWRDNVLPGGGGGAPPLPHPGLRSLPPYQPPPTPSRHHFPTYTSPWLVRVSRGYLLCFPDPFSDMWMWIACSYNVTAILASLVETIRVFLCNKV